MEKAEIFSFPMVPGSGRGSQSTDVVIVVSMVLEVLIKNIDVPKTRDLKTIPM